MKFSKRRFSPVTLVPLFFFVVFAASCSGPEKYGSGVDPGAPEVQIREIFINSALRGEHVTLDGRILNICPSRGCWFYLQDETGRLFVDLAPADLSLPYNSGRTVGSRVRVSGIVKMNQGQPMLEATGVEVF